MTPEQPHRAAPQTGNLSPPAHSSAIPGSATPGSATPGSATPGSATPGSGAQGPEALGITTQGIGARELAIIAWRRKGGMLLCLILSLSLGAVYFVRAERLYQVSSRLLVETQGLPTGAAPEQREKEFLATQAEILGSPAVVQAAAESLVWPTPLPPGGSPTQALLADLEVRPVMGTHVISVSYRSHDVSHALAAVEEVIASYRRYLRTAEQDSSLDALRLLASNEKELRTELQNLELAYRELRKESPLTGSGRNGTDVQLVLVQQIGQKLTEIRNHRIELENQLEATRSWELARRASLTAAPLAPEAASLAPEADPAEARGDGDAQLEPHALARYELPARASRDSASERLITATMFSQMTRIDSAEMQALQTQLSKAELREQELAERYGPKHAELRAVREQILTLDAALQDSLEAAPEILRRQLSAVEASEQRIAELYRMERAKAKELDLYLLREQQARDQIERVHLLHDSLLHQLRQTELASDAVSEGRFGVKVTVLEAPAPPSKPLWPSPLILALVCTAIGLTTAGGWALFAESRQPTFPDPTLAR